MRSEYREKAVAVIDSIESDVQDALNALQKARKDVDAVVTLIDDVESLLEEILHKLV